MYDDHRLARRSLRRRFSVDQHIIVRSYVPGLRKYLGCLNWWSLLIQYYSEPSVTTVYNIIMARTNDYLAY